MIGQRLGAYEITAKLGEGGMGEVWRATDTRLEREVAIKVLPAATLENAGARARLLREARLASRLNHPNVCTIHDVGEVEGRAYIAMELVEGQSLAARLAAGAISREAALRFGSQIAEALAHAHERGVVHRDLKCANVVVTAEGRAKVLDFGLAKRLADENLGDATTLSRHPLTEPGTVAGTLAYMAPEQLRGEPADPRSDIWALGIVLYEMAAGRRPFSGETAFSLSSAILTEPPSPLPPTVSAPLAAVIERALAKEPGERFQRAGEVLAALQVVQSGGGAAIPRQAVRARAKRRRSLAAPGLVLALVALVAALFALDVAGVRSRLTGAAAAASFDSLAVLPFENLSGDPDQGFLAAGIHEALINELGRLGGLRRVIARASALRYEKSDKPLAQVARELGVATLMTGAVLRSGTRIRVTAQLVEPATGAQLWTGSFERELRDVLALQNEIVAAITRQAGLRLTREEESRLASAARVDPVAHEAYLRGRFQLNRFTPEGFEKGIAYMQEAIARDPESPLPYAGLALGYALIGHDALPDAFAKARAAADEAMKRGETLAETEEALAEIALYSEWDWAGAERAFRRALDLNPSLPEAHCHYAWYLELVGRREEAYAEMKRAIELDPLTPVWGAWLAGMYRYAGKYDEAIAVARQSLELNPGFAAGLRVLGDTYAQRGSFEEAIAAHEQAIAANPAVGWGLGHTYALAGRAKEAREIAAGFATKPTPMGTWGLAKIHTALGDRDEAFRWLEAGFDVRFSWMPWIGHDPAFAALASDPRFADLLRRMNVPPIDKG